MLIGLVRDSVMQCLCHTCRAPVLPAVGNRSAIFKKPTKVRSIQPKASKKVKFITTEIRCQEKSKGGLSYEVILAEPNGNVISPVTIRSNTKANKSLSNDEIAKKLKEAEERRLSLEAKKMADWTAKASKIEEIARKKDELNIEFINQTKESLDAKMEYHVEKRDALMSDMKKKLKDHAEEIEKKRILMEQQKELERVAIDEKHKVAAAIRDENMRKMLNHLKEHNINKLAEVKITADIPETEKCMEIKHIFDNKLFAAELKREEEVRKKLEKLREHVRVNWNKKAREDNTRDFKNSYAHWLNNRQADKQIRCDVCKQMFSEKDIWSHVEIHIGASKVPYENYVVSTHGEQKHQQQPESLIPEKAVDDQSVKDESNNPVEAKPFQCAVCGKRYTQRFILTRHLKVHSGDKLYKRNISLSVDKPYKCDICQKSFQRKEYVCRHVIIHRDDRPYKCVICQKSFQRKEYVHRHMKIHKGDIKVSSDIKPYVCPEENCGETFTQNSALKSRRMSHTGECKHFCEECGQGFLSKDHMQIHQRSRHSQKPFTCDICGKSFERKGYIRNHMYIHTGEKTFKCGICGSLYSQRNALYKHSFIHKDGYPVACDICKKSFWLKDSLRRHIRNVHIGKTRNEPIDHGEEKVNLGRLSKRISIRM